jgi:hypothetical protein
MIICDYKKILYSPTNDISKMWLQETTEVMKYIPLALSLPFYLNIDTEPIYKIQIYPFSYAVSVPSFLCILCDNFLHSSTEYKRPERCTVFQAYTFLKCILCDFVHFIRNYNNLFQCIPNSISFGLP